MNNKTEFFDEIRLDIGEKKKNLKARYIFNKKVY